MKQQQAAHEVVCCVYCFWILSARHLLVTPFFDFSFLGGGFIPSPPPTPHTVPTSPRLPPTPPQSKLQIFLDSQHHFLWRIFHTPHFFRERGA